jgi:hypothetical protein
VMIEVRVAERIGVSLIGGYGKVKAESSYGETRSFPVYEVGGQLAVYPMSSFDGLQVGMEALYLHVSVDDAESDVKAAAAGFAVGPLVGYKLVTSGGFTFLAQGGIEYVAIRAEASSTSTSESATAGDSRIIPLLNLNLGWSF